MRNRAERRRNAIAKDLRTPKYAPRVVKPKYEEKLRPDWRKYLEEDDDSGPSRLPSIDGVPTGNEPD